MIKRTIQADNDAEALFLEQAKAMFQELSRTADAAPDGHVLHQAEMCAMTEGRKLIRKALESTLQQQAHEVEKKGRRPEGVTAAEQRLIEEAGRKL